MGDLADGIQHLCLGEELTQAVAVRLGAIPKTLQDEGIPTCEGVTEQRRPQKKRNRKDRRRNDEENGVNKQLSRVEKLRAEGGGGVQRSNSDLSEKSNRLPTDDMDMVTDMIFKSQSSVNINTGVRNLPDSFFNEESNEVTLSKKEEKTKKRKGKKRSNKPVSPEEEDKKGSDKENYFASVNDKMIDDEDGAMGDEQAVYNWRNVTKNGDIKKCVLVEGAREGGRPRAGDAVLVKSQGKLKDGTMIDDYPTLVFRVGEYEVIDGLDLAVQSMHKNELSIISIKPPLAYGSLGRKPDIPPEARITYLFGLLHFEKQKEMSEMTWAQRRKMGQSSMRIANWWYSRKEYPIAVKCYKKALQFYNNIPTNQECSTPEEYKELLTLMEERLRVMRQVANIFKRIANLIQSGQIET